MKKILLLLISCAVVFSVMNLFGLNRADNPEFVTPETAVENVKEKLDDKSVETITNFDSPKVEEIIFDGSYSMYFFEKKTEVKGKKLYRITFNTTQDGLLGPIVFYVDKISGEVIGAGFRE